MKDGIVRIVNGDMKTDKRTVVMARLIDRHRFLSDLCALSERSERVVQ